MTKPEPRDDKLNMRIPSSLKRRLEHIRQRDEVSMADIIVPFLPAVIDGYERSRDVKSRSTRDRSR